MTEVRRRDTAAQTDAASFLARDRRRALSEGRALPLVVTGAALFADISGFTPLTEALAAELGPQHGAEELSIHLDTVFHSIIDDIHSYGGEVLNFSGDAITCWLDGDDGLRAAACGLAIQRTMAGIGRITTSTGTEVVLSIKVAVAVGQAHRFSVGDASEQLLEVLAEGLHRRAGQRGAGCVAVRRRTGALGDPHARGPGDGSRAAQGRYLHRGEAARGALEHARATGAAAGPRAGR